MSKFESEFLNGYKIFVAPKIGGGILITYVFMVPRIFISNILKK